MFRLSSTRIFWHCVSTHTQALKLIICMAMLISVIFRKMPEKEADHLTPATRLLEKKREMAEVEQALQATKDVRAYKFHFCKLAIHCIKRIFHAVGKPLNLNICA